MARTTSISLASGSASLSEIYGYVIDNVMKTTLSMALKSQQYTGNPKAGSVEFVRFENATAKTYGTARSTNAGDKIKAPATTVNLSTHKEIVEEIAKFDVETFGVAGIIKRRADNHPMVMSADLDRAFFTEAESVGASLTTSSTDVWDIVEDAIQKLETTKNTYVDGVERDLINVVLTPAYYGKIRTHLDTLPASNVETVAEEFGMYHGVKVFSSTRLPSGCNGLCMIKGAVAQPVVTDEYTSAQPIPLSNDVWTGLFYDYGTKALTPDLIVKF